MSTFVEVFSLEKNCQVIINLDTVMEIAPLREGGCILYFPDSASVNGRAAIKIRDSYMLFKQFVLETVSAEDIARNVARFQHIEKEPYPQTNLPPEPEKRGRGRPPKSAEPVAQPAAPQTSGMVTTADLGLG